LAPDPNAPGQRGEEEISPVKVRKSKMDAQGVWRVGRGAGVRSMCAEGGKSCAAQTGCASVARAHARWHRTRGSARARVRARTRNRKLHSARLIHPIYCSDHGGIFRRMVFGLVSGPGLKDSTFFFHLDLYFFKGCHSEGKDVRPAPGYRPALGCRSRPRAA
jgi:hypothetical protein